MSKETQKLHPQLPIYPVYDEEIVTPYDEDLWEALLSLFPQLRGRVFVSLAFKMEIDKPVKLWIKEYAHKNPVRPPIRHLKFNLVRETSSGSAARPGLHMGYGQRHTGIPNSLPPPASAAEKSTRRKRFKAHRDYYNLHKWRV